MPRALGAVLLLTVSCSFLVERDRVQCAHDRDCQAAGGDFLGSRCVDSVCQPDRAWGCLGSVKPVQLPVGHRSTATLLLRMRDLVHLTPITNVTARLCRKMDINCESPLVNDVRGDEAGHVVLPVDLGFDGYVDLRAPDRMPGLNFMLPPIDGDREIPFIPLLPARTLVDFAEANHESLREDRGHLMFIAYDCLHRTTPGVTAETPQADGPTIRFFVKDGLPTSQASETDPSGRGGFINLRAGTVVMRAHSPLGQRIATLTLTVRPGTITFIGLVPMPD